MAASLLDIRYKIDGLNFSIASPEQILESSVLEVTEPNLYSKGIPNANACNDLRLGTVDRRFRCGTCRHSASKCMGHHGHIRLGFPVYHWLCFEKVLKSLRCVCYWCSSLLVDPALPENQRRFQTTKKRVRRLAAVSSHCKRRDCFKCGGKQPNYEKEGLSIMADWTGVELNEQEKERVAGRFNAKVAREILQFVSNDDCRFMGFDPETTRPENMVLTVMLVPSVIIRPTTSIQESSRTKGHDDLTTLLRDIVKYSNLVREKLAEKPDEFPTQAYEQLVVHVSTYFDKDGGATTATMSLGGTGAARTTRRHITRSGPLKSLGKRLGGKQGRFRHTIVGKRSNFTSRGVVGPSPNDEIWQLRVPLIVAKTQTVPSRVTPFNVHKMRALVMRGDHPNGDGCHHVERPDGSSINMRMCQDRELVARALRKGWVVHRHMTDGDWALFNRQPTLHKMGMMAHEIIVNRGANTFQLPVPCTPPYNADFDGDEMNLHVFQSPVAISEAKNIMAVPQCLISPKDSKPIIAPVQDAVIGTYLLTSKDTFLKPGTFFDLTMWARHSDRAIPEPAVFYKKDGKWNKLYTGKQLVTHYTPRKIRLQRRVRDLDAAGIHDCFDLDERLVKFEDGELLCGKLCKGTIGGVSRGCIQAVCKAHGNWRAAKWISDLQRIATQFLLRHGFSIGLSDCLHGKAIQDDVDEIVQGTYRRVSDGVAKARGNGFSEAAIEGPCQDIFSSVLSSVASSVLASIPDDNNIRKCIESGAKGKKLNITQIHGCVGQQIVAGARVRDRTDPFQARTFPCYEPGDEDPRAFGFCPSSYVDGLEPVEFFTHAQGGREGLIDTACRTAETGYIQRRLITILQSEKAGFDGTVRDANNGVVQFQYGGDRLNTERLIKVGVPCMTKLADLPPDAAARAWCGGAGEEADRLEEAIRIARSAREVFTTDPLGAVHLPFDLQDHFCVARNGHFPDPEALMDMVAHAEAKIVRLIGPPKSCNHFFLHLRSTLVSKRLEGVSIDTVSDVLDECLQQTEMALVEGGTMVGTIAAQSVGEPATQMTLNSVDYDTGLVLRWRKAPVGLRNACIGETIDTLLDVYAEKVETPEARTSYLPLEAGAAEALTVDDKGRVSWKALEAVTRHPPINKDGSPTLLKVTTKSGRTVTATKAKSFLVVRAGEVVPLEGDKLCVGDKLPVVATLPKDFETTVVLCNKEYTLDRRMGRFVGAHMAKTAMNVPEGLEEWQCDDRVPEFAYSAPDEFTMGLLESFFSKSNGGSIVSSSLAMVEGVSLLLRRFGTHSVLSTSGSAHTLTVQGALFVHSPDVRKVNDVLEDPVVSIEEVVSPHEFVYDLTVAETRNMVTLSGLGTRDTFHSAGTGNRTVMSGVPRFKEMIDCTKNPKAPSMTIFLNDDLAASKDAVQEIAHGMRKVLLAECVLGTPTVHHKTDAVPEDEGMVERYRIVRGWDPTKLFDFYARVVLDKSRLAGLNLGLRDVVRALRASLDEKAIVLSSEPGESQYAVQIHVFKTTALRKGFDRAQTEEESTRLQRDFVHNMVDILVETTRVSGLENVKNTFVVKKGKQYAIETEGTEFTEILASGDAVAVNKTVSNNIHDVFPVLGISATATLAFCEMTMAMTSQGGYISPRHLELLAMKMTFPGQSIPVNRHGMAKTHGVLLRASFERTVDTFVNAGVHSEFDPCKGICQSIVLGQAPPCGTGYVSLIDDPTAIPEKRAAKKRPVEGGEEEEEFVGRRKKKKAGEKRWKEAAASWDFTFDPRRKFRLFLMRTNAFVPMSPVAPTKMMVEDDETPQSPSYSPDGMFAPKTPPVDDEDSMECTTPPPEDEFEPETPPMSEEEDEGVEEEDGVSEETPSTSSATSETTSPVPIVPEWDITMGSPVVSGIPWMIHMESPKYKKKP